MRMGLRCAAVLAAAIAVSSTATGAVTGPAFAAPCIRLVAAAQQVTSAEGSGRVTFTVFTGGCDAAGDVGYTVTAGTAQAGDDFKPLTGHLHWNLGDALDKTVTVPIAQDALAESALEDFTFQLVGPSLGIQITQPAGQGRILDDDGPSIAWSVDDSTCSIDTPDPSCFCDGVFQTMPIEPNCDVIDLDLSAGSPSPVRVRWSTWGGSARPGIDYVPVVDRTQTIAAGSTTGRLVVTLLPDAPPTTYKRWFNVQLTFISNGIVADGTAVVTIDYP